MRKVLAVTFKDKIQHYGKYALAVPAKCEIHGELINGSFVLFGTVGTANRA